MTSTTTFFEAFKGAVLTSINTAMPCRVLAFDEATCTAKIQPLFKIKEVNKEPVQLAPIEGVPVLLQRFKVNNLQAVQTSTDDGVHEQYTGSGAHTHSQITFTEAIEFIPHLVAGDVVQVVFNQRAIDDVLSGNVALPSARRFFSIHDAVVVGVFPK